MKETASEWLVRQAARDVASEAMRRIRGRLREVEADPEAPRCYEAEWVTESGSWPGSPMAAKAWIPYLVEDLSRARVEFESCLNRR